MRIHKILPVGLAAHGDIPMSQPARRPMGLFRAAVTVLWLFHMSVPANADTFDGTMIYAGNYQGVCDFHIELYPDGSVNGVCGSSQSGGTYNWKPNSSEICIYYYRPGWNDGCFSYTSLSGGRIHK